MRSFAVAVLWLQWAGEGVGSLSVGSYYSSPGGSTSTCSIAACAFSSCPIGQKLSGCTAGSPGTCVACTNTVPAGQYYSTYAPDSIGNCGLANCPTCPQGTVSSGCGGTSTGTCTSCGTPPAGKYWDVNANALSNCPQLSKTVCTSGSYTTGSSNVLPGTCALCSGLTAKNYWVAPTAWDSACTQLPQTTCSAGSVNSVVATPQTTSAGTCSLCPALTNNGYYYGPNVDSTSNCPQLNCSDSLCAIGQYISGCGAVSPWTSPGTCANCYNAINTSQVYSTRGSWNNNCGVVGCPTTGCVLGQYVTGCGGLPTALGCGTCTNAVVGTAFYVGVGITSTCGTQNCKVCSNGQYTMGCTTLADGSCTACTN